MLRFERWKIILVLSVCAFAFFYALPNVLSVKTSNWMQSALPGWLPGKTISLGLDLQGGSHILLDVQTEVVVRDRVDSLAESYKSELREARIRYFDVTLTADSFSLKTRKSEDVEKALEIAKKIDRGLRINSDANKITSRLTDEAITEIQNKTLSQSIEIVRRRIDGAGTKEPVIQRQGDSRILVQLPGIDDPERIKIRLGKTAKLTFHLVDEDVTQLGRPKPGTRLLPLQDGVAGERIGIKRRADITGEMLTNATPNFNQGQAIVSFNLDRRGAKIFCKVSSENVNRRFAVVLDKEVISAPVFNEAICGGAAQISGNFTVESANDLALLLRAGALPAPLTVAEERTVGPSLGADSVEAGKKASLVGLALILFFMFISYGRFGLYANVALAVNVCLIFALLSALQATLTLPGIAGIVLTVGMAVDANVLIFERIREEFLTGRSVMSSIDSGYRQAMSTIVDANLTTLIAAILLYSFGTGPIKGFAVTLGIGILTSLFSAVMVTRLLVVTWLRRNKPEELPI